LAGVNVAIDAHPAAALTPGQAIVNAAASQAGVPYCEGGGGIDGPTVGNASSTCDPGVVGYDCMSLAQYAVYQATGITVPLPPASLPGTGTFIPPDGENTSALQPGDVVFFGGSSLDNYSHSGIYAGDGELWDALEPGDTVQEHSFATIYSDYGNVFDGAVQFWTSALATSTITPSVSLGTTTYGSSVGYSATVGGTGGTPTGTVSFTAGSTALCTATLSSGTGSCNASDAPTGSDQTITATYSGDVNFSGSEGTTSLTVNQAAATVVASANPGSTTNGSPVTYAATVSSTGGTPTGTVTFSVGTTTLCTTGTLESGTGSCVAANAPVGDDTVTALYSGDSNFTASSGPAALTVLNDPGVYVPLTPVRICNTRPNNPSGLTGAAAQCNGTNNAGETLPAGGSITLNVAGDFGVPSSDVTAVVLNVTAADTTGAGYFSLFPAGAPRPTTANLNFVANQVVPNLVEVGVGTNGQVSLYSAGPANAIVDLQGYVTTTAQGGAGLYNALSTPARICNTRGGNPSHLSGEALQCNTNTAAGSPNNLVGPTNPLTITVDGLGGVPATGVSAVVLNVTVADAQSAGYITAYPAGATRPTAANVNYLTNQVIGNRVIAPVNTTTGQVTFYAAGATDIIVDVSGYFTATGGTTGAEFTPEPVPVRICNTRGGNPSGLAAPYTQCNTNTARGSPNEPIGPAASLSVQATGLGYIPTGATAAVLNVTAVLPTVSGYLTLYPQGTPPTTSDLNPPANGVLANLAVTTLTGSGTFDVYNAAGDTNVIIDLAGWYSTPPA
jgi:hypothetical protein